MRTREVALLAIATAFSAATVTLLTGLIFNAALQPTYLSLLGVAVGVVMILPVKYIYDNIDELYDRLSIKFGEESGKLLLASIGVIGTYITFFHGYSFPGSSILNLSFQTSYQVFLPVRQLYSGLSTGVSGLLFDFGRLYIQGIWLYLISGVLVDSYRALKNRLVGEELAAGLMPFTGGESEGVTVEVYVVTGWHGVFRIPESFCRECNMFARAAEEAAGKVDFKVDVNIKSFWTRFPRPVLKGGYHAPVMLVGGKLVAQGYDVPDSDRLKQVLEEAR